MSTGRIFKLAALGLATTLLAAGAWTARDGLQKLAQERRQVALMSAQLAAAQQLLPQVEKREQFAKLKARVQAQAGQAGFDPAQWGQRRIVRTSGALSRREVQEQLAQLSASGSGRLLAADSFELSVLSSEAGLFTPPAADDKGLSLAINGTLYFSLAPKP